MKSLPLRQQGAALVTALLILIVLTILSLAATRFTSFSKRISANYEHRAAAFQLAQSGVDAVVEQQEMALPVAGNVGDITCMSGDASADCTYSTIVLPAPLLTAGVTARATRLGPDGFSKAPRLSEDTASTVNVKAVRFEVEGSYNKVANARGLGTIREGILSLIFVPDAPDL